MNKSALLRTLRSRFALDWRGIHGAPHWARVRRIGLRLAIETGADPVVVEAFAFLHDSCRLSDGDDRLHGHRAAGLARELNEPFLQLSEGQLSVLVTACEGHSSGSVSIDATVATCWDADRLDLGRVGIRPDPRYLCTSAARDPRMIAWAYWRSVCVEG